MKLGMLIGFFCFVLSNLLEAHQVSYSDNGLYPKFCLEASNNEEIFSNFKRNSNYNVILEHVNFEQGEEYLKNILQQTSSFVNFFEKFRENDLYGNPKTYCYENYGVFSPTTLRYIKGLSDLTILFKDLRDMDIIEIGGGYGGLCKIIGDLYTYKSYTIVDLPEVLPLVKKYLSKFGVKNVILLTMDQLPIQKEYDLVISNYAFTECIAPIQQIYFDKILSVSKKGYLTCNVFGGSTWSKEEFIQRLSLSGINWREIPERPLTGNKNYCVIW